MSNNSFDTFGASIKRPFILIYGLIGLISTITLLLLFIVSPLDDYRFFLVVLVMAHPVLALTVYFSYKSQVQKASLFAFISILLGFIASFNLEYAAFLAINMIFVLSAPFVMIKKWQSILFYTLFPITFLLKLYFEAYQPFPGFNAGGQPGRETIQFNLIFLFSIVSYSIMINYLLNRGFRDSANLIKTSEVLKETIAIKNKFLAIISHDLRGPIGMSTSLLSRMDNNSLSADPEAIKLLYQLSKNSNELLSNLLLWSKIQKDDSWIDPIHFDLCDCLQEAIELIRSSFEVKNIQVINSCKTETMVYADRRMIATVIRNLLSNAIKFSYEKSVINIWMDTHDDLIKMYVKDHGVGIDKERLPLIFSQSFDNISSKGTANEPGAGMGLILARDFITVNKGKINVESDGRTGSLFWFTVPRKKL
jgi:signal transduction histidine kinase